MAEPESSIPSRVAMVVWDVAALVHAVADALTARFGALAVRGELAGFQRAVSGHCYFTLKDADGRAALRCAMFRRAAALLDFAPGDGALVEVRGRLAVYEPRGELQFVVESMRPAGAGALYERFLRLKAQLQAEGLFAAERKRALPGFPQRIGVVTSRAGAALHDVLSALARRAPQLHVVVYPCPVQGSEAPAALAAAIGTAGHRAEVDTLIVCRGGGSIEDLWAFNEAVVVRAIAACPVPVVVGVGHETDVTLADLAADLRAPTPTAAAELVAPPRDALLGGLRMLAERAARAMGRRLDGEAQRLDRAALRLARPAQVLVPHRERLAAWLQRWRQAPLRQFERRRQALTQVGRRLIQGRHQVCDREAHRLNLLAARLQALDPSRVLERGYAWLGDSEGRAVGSVTQLAAGQMLTVRLADGEALTEVQEVRPDRP